MGSRMENSTQTSEAAEQPSPAVLHRAISASAMGNCMEWYDYGVYGYLAGIIGEVFFPGHSATARTLSTFGVLAVSFAIRPFGGMFFGPLGDKIGRQRVLAITIILMSLSTFVIGIFPSYGAIGFWSPVLLVIARMVQGFSTGGEYGGAATFMAEYSPDRKRGFLSSWLEFGTLSGYVMGAGLATILTAGIGHDSMVSWGWRIPFLIALPLGAVGLYLRLKLEDTPVFHELQDRGQTAKSPVRDLLPYWRPALMCIGMVLLLNVADYTLLTYMPSYMQETLHIGENTSNVIAIVVMLFMMTVITSVGAFSDRHGRKPVLMFACIGFIVLAYPSFVLMAQGSIPLTIVGLAILGFLLVLLLGTMPSTLPSLFPTHVRYGGFAISYNLSTSAFGGTAPYIITALIGALHDKYIPAYYLIGAGVVAILPILLSPETARASLRGRARPGVQTAKPATVGR